MAETTLEEDIANAADEFALDRIMAQEHRNEAQARNARAQERHEAEMAALAAREARLEAAAERDERRTKAAEEGIQAQTELLAKFATDGLTLRDRLALALAPHYMTTTKAGKDTAQADAKEDRERFEFALAEVMKVVEPDAV